MKVIVKYQGIWRSILKTSKQVIDIQDDATFEQLLAKLETINGVSISEHLEQGTVFMAVGGGKFEELTCSQQLSDGSVVLFISPIIGG